MSSSVDDPALTTLNASWAREWVILACFVLLAGFGVWAIWQPQDNSDSGNSAQTTPDSVDSMATGDPTGG